MDRRIVYALKDADGNIFKLNDLTDTGIFVGSLTYTDESLSNDNRIAEKSSLPGSVKLGKTRTQARNISFAYNRVEGVDFADFIAAENELIYNFNKTEYVIDINNNRQVKVAPDTYALTYSEGAHKLSGEGSVSFIMLDPFWTSLDVTTYTLALSNGSNLIVINNEGYIKSQPILTFAASVPVSIVKAYINETKEGIRIDDDTFGTPGFGTMTVDCITGLVDINDVDRNSSIASHTGFFSIPVGENNLILEVNAACDVQVDFYKKEYV